MDLVTISITEFRNQRYWDLTRESIVKELSERLGMDIQDADIKDIEVTENHYIFECGGITFIRERKFGRINMLNCPICGKEMLGNVWCGGPRGEGFEDLRHLGNLIEIGIKTMRLCDNCYQKREGKERIVTQRGIN